MKPRLIIVVNNALFFLSHRAHIARAAVRSGYDVAIACPSGPLVSEIKSLGIRHLDYPLPRGVGSALQEFRAFWTLWAIFRNERPDVVHLVTSKPVILGGLLTSILRIPTLAAITGLGHIYIEHDIKSRFLRSFANGGYRMALRNNWTFTIFQNETNIGLFRRLNILGPHYNLIKGAGVNLAQFDPDAKCAIGAPIVLLPARMLKTKGVLDFVEAARILKRNGITARFILAGAPDDGNPASVTTDELQAFTAAGDIEWIGHQDDISSTMADASIVVLPSFYSEGMPKSLLDAAAAGRPVITTDIAGCRDAIVNGKTGLIVKPRDPNDLADKIAELIADEPRRHAMGRAARELAEAEYSDISVAEKHIEIYNILFQLRKHRS